MKIPKAAFPLSRKSPCQNSSCQRRQALIAASAKRAGAILVTLNQKHYPMKDIEVRIPYKK